MYKYITVFVILITTPLWAANRFPYTAQITENEAIVYSEPGEERYETLRLRAGEAVEVYSVTPEGWCAVRPPVGSFSWVSGLYVNAGLNNIGIVSVDHLASRVGSQTGDICKTVQVQLKKGERVILLEKVETPENVASPIWYKIVPPSGEFRWVRLDSITASAFSENSSPSALAIQQVSYQQQPEANPVYDSGSQLASPVAQPMPLTETPSLASRNVVSSQARPLPQTIVSQSAVPLQQANPYQRALSQLHQEVHAVMNRPTDDGTFEVLIQKGRLLVESAPSETDRTRAYQLVNTLEKTRNVRRMNAFQRQPAQYRGGNGVLPPSNQNLAALPVNAQVPQGTGTMITQVQYPPTPTGALETASQNSTSPFKAAGKLGWFSQRPEGYPPYAVVNEQNRIVALITPEPGVDLKPYIDKQVGVNGTSGVYVNGQQRTPHVSATTVFALQ